MHFHIEIIEFANPMQDLSIIFCNPYKPYTNFIHFCNETNYNPYKKYIHFRIEVTNPMQDLYTFVSKSLQTLLKSIDFCCEIKANLIQDLCILRNRCKPFAETINFELKSL